MSGENHPISEFIRKKSVRLAGFAGTAVLGYGYKKLHEHHKTAEAYKWDLDEANIPSYQRDLAILTGHLPKEKFRPRIATIAVLVYVNKAAERPPISDDELYAAVTAMESGGLYKKDSSKDRENFDWLLGQLQHPGEELVDGPRGEHKGLRDADRFVPTAALEWGMQDGNRPAPLDRAWTHYQLEISDQE